MSTIANPETGVVAANLSALQRVWGWLFALGVLFILLGTAGLGMTYFLTLATLVLFGMLLVGGGAVQLIHAFKMTGWKSVVWHVLIAMLYLGAGISIVSDPAIASVIVTLLLAGAITAAGVMRVFMALQHRDVKGWGWLCFGGLLSIALGVMIYARWPWSGLWVIGMLVSIELIVHGWSYVILALAARRMTRVAQRVAAPAAA